jgi:hypothetical protein
MREIRGKTGKGLGDGMESLDERIIFEERGSINPGPMNRYQVNLLRFYEVSYED